MSDLVTALRAELKELDSELRADPRFRRVAKIRDLLAEYEPGTKTSTNYAAGYVIDLEPEPHQPRTGSKEERVKAVVVGILKIRGQAHRKLILAQLVGAGLMGTEKNPMRALAIYLSAWKREGLLESDGAGNFRLTKQ